MKFRVIQSNDRGLITHQGDRTYASRGPAKGEEAKELPTLFIWVCGKQRYLARCWTRWTGELLGDDFIYVVSQFRDVIDLQGDTRYHQWCSKQLRQQLWDLERPALDTNAMTCPPPEAVYAAHRHKAARYLHRRKQRLREQTPELSAEEVKLIQQLYDQRDILNRRAGFIQYHVDHIIPLAKGGRHHPDNLRVISASDNVRKGAKVVPPFEQASGIPAMASSS